MVRFWKTGFGSPGGLRAHFCSGYQYCYRTWAKNRQRHGSQRPVSDYLSHCVSRLLKPSRPVSAVAVLGPGWQPCLELRSWSGEKAAVLCLPQERLPILGLFLCRKIEGSPFGQIFPSLHDAFVHVFSYSLAFSDLILTALLLLSLRSFPLVSVVSYHVAFFCTGDEARFGVPSHRDTPCSPHCSRDLFPHSLLFPLADRAGRRHLPRHNVRQQTPRTPSR